MATPAPPSLIVHADDFGLSEAVNHGILDAHSNGVLTSTSIMAGAEAFDHAVGLSLASPSLDVGVHLTLVEEQPVLDPALIPSLLGENRRFHRHATVFTSEYFRGRISLVQVEAEFEAQIGKVLAAGLRVSHLDSHQHLHMLPGVLKVTLDLARRHGVPFVRFPRETIAPYMLRAPAGASRVAQLAVLNLFCALGEKRFAGRRTDHFVGFYHGGDLNRANLRALAARLPACGVTELMCHPGRDDPASGRAHWGYGWAAELEALTDPEVARILQRRGVSLISYRDMAS